jgi:hypothetical protein
MQTGPARPAHNRMAASHLLPRLLAVVAIIGALGGCTSTKPTDQVPDLARGFRPHVQQVLDNIALFTKDPGAWPSHVLVYKGFFETRKQWTGSIGTSTKLEDVTYGTAHWDLSSLDDPYDIQRVRLLYQWQVGHITFDQLEHDWNEIRDRQVLDGSGKPVLGSDGRPTFLALPLPVSRQTKRDWITDSLVKSPSGMFGTSGPLAMPGTVTVWVADMEGATQFSLAVLSAMANTRVKARWGDAAMMIP